MRPKRASESSSAAPSPPAALAALGADLVPGAPTLLDLVGFDETLPGHDLVVTGEGQIDTTTAEGKAPGEIARRCAVAGVRCVVFGGRVRAEISGAETIALSGEPDRAEADLVDLGGKLAA